MNKKWSSGKITAVAIGGSAGFIILMAALFFSILELPDMIERVEVILGIDYSEADTTDNYDAAEGEDSYRDEYGTKDSAPDYPDEDDNDKRNSQREETDKEYYEFGDAIREDLLYEVEFKKYYYALPEDPRVTIEFVYPEITGTDVPNLENINAAIQKEFSLIEEYVQAVPEYMEGTESYCFEGTGYVTYMDEEILSVVYVEYEYFDEEYLDSYLVSVNIDMRSGMVINNTNLLNVDDDFAIDFRYRCEAQNGEMEYLDLMSDQEIASYLLDADTLVIFYTPLGMEIGFNFYGGWATVTYKDYLQFIKTL